MVRSAIPCRRGSHASLFCFYLEYLLGIRRTLILHPLEEDSLLGACSARFLFPRTQSFGVMGRYLCIFPERVTKQHLSALLNYWFEDGEFNIIIKSSKKRKKNGNYQQFQFQP